MQPRAGARFPCMPLSRGRVSHISAHLFPSDIFPKVTALEKSSDSIGHKPPPPGSVNLFFFSPSFPFSLFPLLPSFHLLNFEFLLCRNEMALYSQPQPKLGMMKSFSPSCTNLFIRSEHFSFPRFCRLSSFHDSDLNTSYAMPCRTWA